MDKKFILLVTFAIILGISVFVSAVQKEMNFPGTTTTADFTEQSFKFVKGWNLVQGVMNPEWIQKNSNYIKAIFIFNPKTKEYVRFYPNPENNKIGETNYRWEHFATIGATWVYSEKEFTSNYWKFEDFPLDSTYLFAGWNFVGITSKITGKSIDNIKGDCSIEKVFFWSAPANKWFEFSFSEIIDREYTGTGLVLKVSSDCNLGTSKDITAPPAIPN